MSNYQAFTDALLEWYAREGRDLPWRHTTDPYRIWISEIMLQQTQVSRVAEQYYPRFFEAFPDVETLAKSSWDEVLEKWRGLGYYRRGRNVLKAAQILVKHYKSELPTDHKTLVSLPGIGNYTASAIQAFAWDGKVPAIDTNISKIIRILWPKKKVETVANQLVQASPSGRDWNNAMMDLSTALRESKPIAGTLGDFFPEDVAKKFIPLRKKLPTLPKKKKKYKHRIEVGVACIHRDGKYLIQTRPKGKTFEGMWEFPGGKREKGEDFRGCVKREIQEELGLEISVRPHFFEITHNFKEAQLVLRFHRCQILKGTPHPHDGQVIDWIAPSDFGKKAFLSTNSGALEKLQGMKM